MIRCKQTSRFVLSAAAVFALIGGSARAQYQLQPGSLSAPQVITFDGFTNAAGFSAGASGVTGVTADGALSANDWAITGAGTKAFGATTGATFLGTWNGSNNQGGIYSSYLTGNGALMIQPTGTVFENGGNGVGGTVTLRIQNNTGQPINALNIGYQMWMRNDGDRQQRWQFLYSTDDVTYTVHASGDLVTPGGADANPAFVPGATPNMTIGGLNIAPGGTIFLRWRALNSSLPATFTSGSRDKIAIDNISIQAVPAPNNGTIGQYTSAATTGAVGTTDLTTIVHAAGVDDAISAPITIPTFYYNGVAYDRIVVSTNGWVAFGRSSDASFPPAGLSNGIPVNNPASWQFFSTPMAAALWDDLRVGANGAVSVAQSGSEFIIRWRNMEWGAQSALITFEMRLRKGGSTNNQIAFLYGSSTQNVNQSATVGIINRGDVAAPNNFVVYQNNGVIGAGATTTQGTSNVTNLNYGNIPAGAGVLFNHYNALLVETANVSLAAVDANGGTATGSITVRNLGTANVTFNQTNLAQVTGSSGQFTIPTFSATATPDVPITFNVQFTANCPVVLGALTAVYQLNVAGNNTFYASGSGVGVQAFETNPVLSLGAPSVAFAPTVVGQTATQNISILNSGNAAYAGTLTTGNSQYTATVPSVPAQFDAFGNPNTSYNLSGVAMTVTYAPTPALHAATANPTTWIATQNLTASFSAAGQTCGGLPTFGIAGSSTAPRFSIAVNGNNVAPQADLDVKIFRPNSPSLAATAPDIFNTNFTIRNTGSAAFTLPSTGLTEGTGQTRYTVARVSGTDVVAPGSEQQWRITFTPQVPGVVGVDFPSTGVTNYAGVSGVTATQNFVTVNGNFNIAPTAPAGVNIAGYWHNFANGSLSTFVGENLTNIAQVGASIRMTRGESRVILGTSNLAQIPVYNASSQLSLSGVAGAATLLGTGSPITLNSFWGANGDRLPNGGQVIGAGNIDRQAFYVVNTGNANARFYVRKTLQVTGGGSQANAAFSGISYPGTIGLSTNGVVIDESDPNYYVFTLEPMYTSTVTGGISKSYVRFEFQFAPNGANTPGYSATADYAATAITTDRTAQVEIITEAILQTGAANSTALRNTQIVPVVGRTSYVESIAFTNAATPVRLDLAGVQNLGAHNLASAISSNYPFPITGQNNFTPKLSYSAPFEEVSRVFGVNTTTVARGFGLRDTVVVLRLRNLGNTTMDIASVNNIAASTLSGAGLYTVVAVATPQSFVGTNAPIPVTFPFNLVPFGSSFTASPSTSNELIVWLQYDAGSIATGQIGTSTGRVEYRDNTVISTRNRVAASYSNFTASAIRPYPVVNLASANAQESTIQVSDGTIRTIKSVQAPRAARFDNYCNVAGLGANSDTVRFQLTVGNGNPLPTVVGGIQDGKLTPVTYDFGAVVFDSVTTLSGVQTVIPSLPNFSSSRSFSLDYNAAVVINTPNQSPVSQTISATGANRFVTLQAGQTATFTVMFVPTALVPPGTEPLRARVRVPHNARNNNEISHSTEVSYTSASNPAERGDVYGSMQIFVWGNSVRPALRVETAETNYLRPTSAVNPSNISFNLPYTYLNGVFLGDSNFVKVNILNSQSTADGSAYPDPAFGLSTGRVGIRRIYITGANQQDFQIVGFNTPGSTRTTTAEPNPVAFPLASGAPGALIANTNNIVWQVGNLGSPYFVNIANGNIASLYIHFKPTRGTSFDRQAVLVIETDDRCQTEFTYNLSGRMLDAVVTLNTNRVDFGNVQVGDVAQRTFTMTNSGNYPAFFSQNTLQFIGGTPLYSHNYSTNVLGYDVFSALPPTNFNLIGETTPLFPGNSRDVVVAFAPSSTGRKNALTTIAYIPEVPATLANGGMQQVTLSGRGVDASTLSFTPSVLDFGSIAVNSTRSLGVTIRNLGQTDLTVQLPATTIGAFSHNVTGVQQVTIPAGASVPVTFTYAPTSVNASGDNALFTFTIINAFGQPQYDVAVSGRSSSSINAPANVDFGVARVFTEVNAAGQNTRTPVTISNASGLASVRIDRISGVNADEFYVSNSTGSRWTLPFTVTATGTTATFFTTFAPNALPANVSAPNARRATIQVTVFPTSGASETRTIELAGDGAVPQLSFEGANVVNGEINFGTVSSAGASRSFTVRNIGRYPLEVTRLLVSGANAGSYEIPGAPKARLEAGAAMSPDPVVVFKAGAAVTNASARIMVESNSQETRSVELTGSRSTAKIGISRNQLEFGQVTVNQSLPQMLVLSNSSSMPVTITGLAVGGANASEFRLIGTSKSLPTTLEAGQELVANVNFTPSTEGAKVGRLNVMTSAGEVNVDMFGSAVVAKVALSSQNINFGNLPVGKSREMTVSVSNTGSQVVNVTGIEISGDASAMFVLNGTTTFALQPSESKQVSVIFTPTSAGMKFATARFTTDAANQLTAGLVGVGGAAVLSVQNKVDFGTVAANNFREVQIAVNNTGDASLEVNSASLVGANASEFSVVSALPILVNPGSSALVTVRFAPTTDARNRVATLRLENNTGASKDIELLGNALISGVTGESPVAVSFGITEVAPNPVVEKANVSYTLSAASNVSIKVYNAAGVEVATLVNTNVAAGTYSVEFKSGNLASGSYIVRMEANGQVSTQTLNIVK